MQKLDQLDDHSSIVEIDLIVVAVPVPSIEETEPMVLAYFLDSIVAEHALAFAAVDVLEHVVVVVVVAADDVLEAAAIPFDFAVVVVDVDVWEAAVVAFDFVVVVDVSGVVVVVDASEVVAVVVAAVETYHY